MSKQQIEEQRAMEQEYLLSKIKRLRAERDRLREAVKEAMNNLTEAEYIDDVLDQLRAAIKGGE